jgi:hypothetical protein
MNWNRFVRGEEQVVRAKSHNLYLDRVMEEFLDRSTLAHWVRETNERLALTH